MINENRKVCISTWYRSTNYGTGLQALALRRFLEDLGYSCYFLEDKREGKKRNTPAARRKISVSLIRIAVSRLKNRKSFDRRRKLIRKYDQEHNKVFEINTEEDIKRLNRETDIFIAGGDQIWNPYVLEKKHLFTMVQDDKKMISFGTCANEIHSYSTPSFFISSCIAFVTTSRGRSSLTNRSPL